MTVNDLIKQLQAMSEEDRERVVVVQNLGRNGYSPLREVDISWHIPSARSGDDSGVVLTADLQTYIGLVSED